METIQTPNLSYLEILDHAKILETQAFNADGYSYSTDSPPSSYTREQIELARHRLLTKENQAKQRKLAESTGEFNPKLTRKATLRKLRERANLNKTVN